MSMWIRAEDFDIQDDVLILGGRILERSSILSYYVHGRASLEAIGLAGLLAGLGFGLVKSLDTPMAAGAMGIGMIVLLLGLLREFRRRFVLSLQMYQIGKFEVRGLTLQEARLVDELLASGIINASPGPRLRSSGGIES